MRPKSGMLNTSAIDVPMSRSLSTGTLITSRVLTGSGRLHIDNGTEYDAVLKLVDVASQKSVAEFYVGASSSFTLQGIPDGMFDVLFALGTDWDSASGLFTRDKMYSRFVDPLPYTTTQTQTEIDYPGWSLTLHTLPGGKARTDGISEQDFLSK
jgi:hypothetical protein